MITKIENIFNVPIYLLTKDNQYDVGVDNNEFRPISWGNANGLIQRQINNSK